MKDGIIAVNVEGQGNIRIEYDNTAIGPRDILQIVQVSTVIFFRCGLLLHTLNIIQNEGFTATVQVKKKAGLKHGQGIRK